MLIAATLFLGCNSMAHATDLPSTVLSYLRQKNPAVSIRFDGLVRFPNGETYLPVIPQDLSTSNQPKKILSALPQNSAYPDIVEFDNHYFLLRLIETSSGRTTFAKLDNYPIQLKEGLLPQDLVLPANLFIPIELKVILGGLPYNPNFTPVKQAATPVKVVAQKGATSTNKPSSSPSPTDLPVAQTPDKVKKSDVYMGYIFDVVEQKLYGIDPLTGHRQVEVSLDCAPSDLQLSPDGKFLFAPCQSTNELTVIDTGANLVKTRLPVGQRPSHALYVPSSKQVLVSSLYTPSLSVMDAQTLLPAEKIELPGNGGAMAVFPEVKTLNRSLQNVPEAKPTLEKKKDAPVEPPAHLAAIADSTTDKIYILNLDTKTVDKTFTALPDISAIVVLPGFETHAEIWAVSRTKNQLIGLDAVTGNMLITLDVGKKPVALASKGTFLYVLCAGDAQLNVVDRKPRLARPVIELEENTFPSAIRVLPGTDRAYITGATADKMFVLNLNTGNIETTLPVTFRASQLALRPEVEKNETETFATPINGKPAEVRPVAMPQDLPPSTHLMLDPAPAEQKNGTQPTKLASNAKLDSTVTPTPVGSVLTPSNTPADEKTPIQDRRPDGQEDKALEKPKFLPQNLQDSRKTSTEDAAQRGKREAQKTEASSTGNNDNSRPITKTDNAQATPLSVQMPKPSPPISGVSGDKSGQRESKQSEEAPIQPKRLEGRRFFRSKKNKPLSKPLAMPLDVPSNEQKTSNSPGTVQPNNQSSATMPKMPSKVAEPEQKEFTPAGKSSSVVPSTAPVAMPLPFSTDKSENVYRAPGTKTGVPATTK